jgi:hypothetical protein
MSLLFKGLIQSKTIGTPFGESPQEKIGTIQRRLAWPLRKDDTHKSRMYHFLAPLKDHHLLFLFLSLFDIQKKFPI